MKDLIHKERFRRPYRPEKQVKIRPIFEDFHFLKARDLFVYPRHQHANYEVILVEKGPYRCELNGEALELQDGEMLVVKPSDWHSDHFRRGQRHYVLHFRLETEGPSGRVPRLFREGVVGRDQVVPGEHGYNAVLLAELRREALSAQGFAGSVQDALLEALFWRIVRDLPARALSPEVQQMPHDELERDQLVAAFWQWVEKPAEVGDVARSLKMSPRKLANRSRALLGESPARLLTEFKIRRAEELLRLRRLQVQEVSHRLGFSNPFHFSRVFRRLRGYSPREARTTADPRSANA